VAKKVLRLPASLGYPQELVSNLDKVSDLSFTTAIGLVIWGSQMQKGGLFHLPGLPFKSVDKAAGQLRSWFKSLLP
jgi:hypothetical protein